VPTSQETHEPAQPFPLPDAFPPLPAIPGVSNIYPQTTATPASNGARECDPCHEGVTGVGLWLTGGTTSPTTLPLVRFVNLYPRNVSHFQAQPALSFPSATFPVNWIEIPQRNYNHGSKQFDFKRSENILFSTKDHPGINLGDALRKDFSRLNGRDDPALLGGSGVISCRLLVGFSC
jgi:hypothetical protein